MPPKVEIALAQVKILGPPADERSTKLAGSGTSSLSQRGDILIHANHTGYKAFAHSTDALVTYVFENGDLTQAARELDKPPEECSRALQSGELTGNRRNYAAARPAGSKPRRRSSSGRKRGQFNPATLRKFAGAPCAIEARAATGLSSVREGRLQPTPSPRPSPKRYVADFETDKYKTARKMTIH